jgi:hypothetical protein
MGGGRPLCMGGLTPMHRGVDPYATALTNHLLACGHPLNVPHLSYSLVRWAHFCAPSMALVLCMLVSGASVTAWLTFGIQKLAVSNPLCRTTQLKQVVCLPAHGTGLTCIPLILPFWCPTDSTVMGDEFGRKRYKPWSDPSGVHGHNYGWNRPHGVHLGQGQLDACSFHHGRGIHSHSTTHSSTHRLSMAWTPHMETLARIAHNIARPTKFPPLTHSHLSCNPLPH